MGEMKSQFIARSQGCADETNCGTDEGVVKLQRKTLVSTLRRKEEMKEAVSGGSANRQ